MKMYRATCDCGQAATRPSEDTAWGWATNHECTREPAALVELTVEEMVRDNRKLALKAASAAVRRYRIQFDEAYADALVGLWDAARRYQPDTGVQFSTYAWPRIAGEIVDGIRERGPFSRSMCAAGTTPDVISLDAPAYTDSPVPLTDLFVDGDNETTWVARLDAIDDVRRMLNRLGPRDRKIIAARLSGGTCLAIGADHGISEARVSQIVRRTLDTLDSHPLSA